MTTGPRVGSSSVAWETPAGVMTSMAFGTVVGSTAQIGLVPPTAHILLASPGHNKGQRLARRGYAYTDGVDASAAAPAIGLMFLCFNSDPRKQFIPIQSRIAGKDALSVYLTHIGSAIFACPPGAQRGGFVGQELLG